MQVTARRWVTEVSAFAALVLSWLSIEPDARDLISAIGEGGPGAPSSGEADHVPIGRWIEVGPLGTTRRAAEQLPDRFVGGVVTGPRHRAQHLEPIEEDIRTVGQIGQHQQRGQLLQGAVTGRRHRTQRGPDPAHPDGAEIVLAVLAVLEHIGELLGRTCGPRLPGVRFGRRRHLASSPRWPSRLLPVRSTF